MITPYRRLGKAKTLVLAGTLSLGLLAFTLTNTLFDSTTNLKNNTTVQNELIFITNHDNYYKLYSQLSKALTSETLVSEEKIYELVVNDNLTYYFNSQEDVQQVLQQVLDNSVGTVFDTDVALTLENDSLNTDIAFNEILVKETPTLQKQEHDLALSTSSKETISTLDSIQESIPKIEALDLEHIALTLINDVTSISFSESITINEVSQDQQTISTVDKAISDLLKTNVTPDTYFVELGDSPYSIALDNNMSLDEIYALNDGLEEKAKSIKVGDPVIIEKLVPELSVVITKEEEYLTPISYETIYRDDPNVYKGLEIATTEGVDGVMLVTDIIKTSNDEVIERTTLSEEVIQKPSDEIISIGTKEIPETGSVGFIVKPTNYSRITAYFGSYGSYWNSKHTGVDLKVSSGTSVRAADGGVVIYAGWKGAYGYMIDIDHGNGVVTRYAHNSTLLVSVGDEVGQGQLISKSGSTGNSSGPHLHFELIFDGTAVDPLDWFNVPYDSE